MSDIPKPSDIPNMNSEQLKQTAESILNDAPPEVQQAVQKTQSFYQENKQLVLTAAACLVLYKIEKRMVKKVVTKALLSTPVTLNVAQYMDDYKDWYDTYQSIV